jgi:hypothetical protein
VALTLIGLVLTALFFVYQMQSGKRSLVIELVIGLVASVALGFGTLFMMLSFGLYI